MRTREEQIKPWGYISPFATETLRDRAKCDLTITKKPTHNITMALYTEEHILEAERRAEQRVRAEIARELKNPECVHVNMLRGEIAALSWGQLMHLFPKEYENIRRDSERLDWLEREFILMALVKGPTPIAAVNSIASVFTQAGGIYFRSAIDAARDVG